MEPGLETPICPPPWDEPNDVLPMLVMLGVFLLLGWLFRSWRKRRKTKNRTS